MTDGLVTLSCLTCGTASQLSRHQALVCPVCDARRVEAIVAERCAPLVEAIEQAHEAHELALWEDTTYWLSEGMKRIGALRAHREREGRDG